MTHVHHTRHAQRPHVEPLPAPPPPTAHAARTRDTLEQPNAERVAEDTNDYETTPFGEDMSEIKEIEVNNLDTITPTKKQLEILQYMARRPAYVESHEVDGRTRRTLLKRCWIAPAMRNTVVLGYRLTELGRETADAYQICATCNKHGAITVTYPDGMIDAIICPACNGAKVIARTTPQEQP